MILILIPKRILLIVLIAMLIVMVIVMVIVILMVIVIEIVIVHPVSVRRFPSFRTQPLENLSHYL